MTTQFVEQERIKKEEMAIGAGGLIILLLLVFALAKKKEEVPPSQGEGKPIIAVKSLGFEGSPQTAKITKAQGQSFTALIGIENTGGAGDVLFELGIGDITWGINNDKGNSPWKATLHCIKGSSTVRITGTLSSTFPARPASPYDAWVTVQGKTYDFPDCFTVILSTPTVSVLSLSWL